MPMQAQRRDFNPGKFAGVLSFQTVHQMGFMLLFLTLAASAVFGANPQPVTFTHGTRVWPTYTYSREETDAPLFKAVENAGIYPYTAFDWESRSEKPSPVTYESLVLENEYLRVEFLPELGGRVWSAYDKVAKRELFYHPTVIKPGRYNNRNAWPVGNLELYGPYDSHMITWPGEPWPWALVRHPDGSATVILSHIDHFFRDKMTLEVTLHPGKAYLELTIHLYNRNLLPNRYLIWTNAGVKAYEDSRFIYPMTKTIGHVSSAIREWPIIDDVDLSWNKNNKNMLGVFGLDIDDSFMSIYDSGNDFGTVCYTNRLLARGEKTWTFGSGLTAYRQAESYTDKDGIYMETQSGRFIWDGDYEFIDPGKSDGWTEYWFGANKLGGLTTATKDVAINLDIPAQRPGAAKLAVSPTGAWPGAALELYAGDEKVWSQTADLVYGQALHAEFELAESTVGKVLELKILSQDRAVLLDHKFYPNGERPEASYASDSIPRKWGPLESLNVEEAYQKGLGNEKFGQITDAERAYNAALAKDPLFSLAHLRLGLLALDRFQVEEAVEHFEKVLERDPSSGDAHYFLGVAYAELGKHLDARRNYYKLLPSSDKYNLRDYGLGLLALSENDLSEAAQKLTAAAALTPEDVSVRQAYAYLLRKIGRGAEAENARKAILQLDATNAFVPGERWIQVAPGFSPASAALKGGATFKPGQQAAAELLDHNCVRHPQGYLELATEYFRLSAWQEAAQVLDHGIEITTPKGQAADPLLLYYRAYATAQLGDQEAAKQFVEKARREDLKLVIFPFRAEDVKILRTAMRLEPNDANAAALLGDLLYSRNRPEEAMQLWAGAVQSDPQNFSALRNLGMATLQAGKQEEGLGYLTRASEARPSHLDTAMLVANVNASLGHTEQARKAFERLLQIQPDSDQVLQKLASLEAQMGNDARALEIMDTHKFQATHLSYSLLHLYRGVRLMLALQAAKNSQFPAALADVAAATKPSSSLGVDDFASVKSSRLLMYDALLQQAAGNSAAAQADWQAAAQTLDDDIEGEGLFRAIGLYKSGQVQKAEDWFKEFAVVNEQRKTDNAVDLRLHAYDLAGIYAAMRGDDTLARENFTKALEIDQSYLYARQSMAWLDGGMLNALKQ
jgi:Tfp pilus assembly protein PilF